MIYFIKNQNWILPTCDSFLWLCHMMFMNMLLIHGLSCCTKNGETMTENIIKSVMSLLSLLIRIKIYSHQKYYMHYMYNVNGFPPKPFNRTQLLAKSSLLIRGAGVTFVKIVFRCTCRTSKIWLSLYQFFTQLGPYSPTSIPIRIEKHPILPNWVIFTIICSKYTIF